MNMQQLMRQAQNMQRKMKENQDKLEQMEFEGNSSNLVTVVLKGNGSMKSIKIKEDVVNKEDIETLEDLIMVAFNNAKTKLDEETNSSISDATGGIDLKNFKLPF